MCCFPSRPHPTHALTSNAHPRCSSLPSTTARSVFCLTPKGKTIRLPRGGTPLDFAYAIHSRVGNTCARAKVNGRHAKLNRPLRSGDLVEITTDPSTQPAAKWERMVVTGKARAEIRRKVNVQAKSSREAEGRQLLAKAMQTANLDASDDEVLRAAKAVLDGVMVGRKAKGRGRAVGSDGVLQSAADGSDGSSDASADGDGDDDGSSGSAPVRLRTISDVYPCIFSGLVPLRKVMAILRREAQEKGQQQAADGQQQQGNLPPQQQRPERRPRRPPQRWDAY